MMTSLLVMILLQLPAILGAVNPKVTQENIKETICKSGWSVKQRPSDRFIFSLKIKMLTEQHLPGRIVDYELDHYIPLELGGHPTSLDNLWMEPYSPKPDAHEKDKIENYLHRQVCAGKMTLTDAQKIISTDWVSLYISLQLRKIVK